MNDVKSKYKKIKRDDLLKETNDILKKNGHKPISLGSLKRYLTELKNMNDDDKRELYEDIEYIKKERQKDLSDALESSEEDSKKVKICNRK